MLSLTDHLICRETFTCERRDEVSGIESKCKSPEAGGQSNVRRHLLQFDPACLRWPWGEGRARATPCQCLLSHSGCKNYLVVRIISTVKSALYLTPPRDPSIQSRFIRMSKDGFQRLTCSPLAGLSPDQLSWVDRQVSPAKLSTSFSS